MGPMNTAAHIGRAKANRSRRGVCIIDRATERREQRGYEHERPERPSEERDAQQKEHERNASMPRERGEPAEHHAMNERHDEERGVCREDAPVAHAHRAEQHEDHKEDNHGSLPVAPLA